ncbi:uncharacterized protein LOC135501685 [Lineus longissimus]|uniref:uncharacterized protein LOC135501685 n=1 Tax=Lineus longissimus TaxID=88925 RepID=UPI00315D6B59
MLDLLLQCQPQVHHWMIPWTGIILVSLMKTMTVLTLITQPYQLQRDQKRRHIANVAEMSVQTDQIDLIAAIEKDHTYSKKVTAALQPSKSASSLAEVKTSKSKPGSRPSPPVVTPPDNHDMNEEGSVAMEDDAQDLDMLDVSVAMEDDAKDLDFSPPTETESESDADSECDPSDEPPASTNFEDIQNFVPPMNAADDRKFLVFESCVVSLFRKCQKTGCAAEVSEFKRTVVGSRLVVQTKCTAGCNFTWSSQPTLNRMGAGNLLLSAAILFSGNTYARLQDISDYLKLPILSWSQFFALQKCYLFPVINETWKSCQFGVVNDLSRESNIVLSGDGRCDRPGHSAKYGTYSLMDVNTGLIVDFVVLNKADPQVKNSNAMEPMGLRMCLENMKKWNISVNILTTDRHITVRKIIRVEFPEITHQFDLWHFCKSILYHTANIHVWKDKKFFHTCQHPPPW